MAEGREINENWEISAEDVKQLLDDGADFLLIDCRTDVEYQIARIEGARLIPLQQLAAHLPDLEEHADDKVVVHCHHGGRSLQMTAMLREQGFKDVRSMAGGIDYWAMKIDPAITRY